MKIHSDTLTRQDFADAADHAGIKVVKLTVHGSRSRARAFNFIPTGHSKYGGQYGLLDYAAATWDEWGVALNHLFDIDPLAHCGKVYLSAEHFHWSTGGHYHALTPPFQHIRHRWESVDTFGSYYATQCDCGAYRRFMKHGHEFAELAS